MKTAYQIDDLCGGNVTGIRGDVGLCEIGAIDNKIDAKELIADD